MNGSGSTTYQIGSNNSSTCNIIGQKLRRSNLTLLQENNKIVTDLTTD